mmetsp:Transcript_1682/g.6805  ORF Transcript_1682/g.6805 Transcript_1682/m.6805 type:complete len:411 (-) Transcript_1682:702-1934(-)
MFPHERHRDHRGVLDRERPGVDRPGNDLAEVHGPLRELPGDGRAVVNLGQSHVQHSPSPRHRERLHLAVVAHHPELLREASGPGGREAYPELLHVQRREFHVPRSDSERRDADARHGLRVFTFAPREHGVLVGQRQRRCVLRPVRLVDEPEPALSAHVLEGHARLHVVAHENVSDVEGLVQREARRVSPRGALDPELARLRDDRDEVFVVRQRVGLEPDGGVRGVSRRQQAVVARVLELGDAKVPRRRGQDAQPSTQRRLVPDRQPHLVRLPELELVELDDIGLHHEHVRRVDRRAHPLSLRAVETGRNLRVPRVAKVRLLAPHTRDDPLLEVPLPRGHSSSQLPQPVLGVPFLALPLLCAEHQPPGVLRDGPFLPLPRADPLVFRRLHVLGLARLVQKRHRRRRRGAGA